MWGVFQLASTSSGEVDSLGSTPHVFKYLLYLFALFKVDNPQGQTLCLLLQERPRETASFPEKTVNFPIWLVQSVKHKPSTTVGVRRLEKGPLPWFGSYTWTKGCHIGRTGHGHSPLETCWVYGYISADYDLQEVESASQDISLSFEGLYDLVSTCAEDLASQTKAEKSSLLHFPLW